MLTPFLVNFEVIIANTLRKKILFTKHHYEIKRKWLRRAEKLCYNVRSMKTVIWFFGTGNFASTHMFRGLMRFGASRGWRVLALPRPRGDASMKAMLKFWKPDGIIADIHYSPESFGSTAVVIMAKRPQKYRGSATFIQNPTEETVRLAVNELQDLGYANFAFVNAVGDKDWSRSREICFRKMLTSRRLPCASCESPRSDHSNPLRFQKRLRRFLACLPKPCAVLAAHDSVGRDVIYAVNALGLDIPGEIAVCGIDNDTDICLETTPTLTSVANDFEAAGRMAGEAFEELFNGHAVPDGVHKPSVVIRRGSTSRLLVRDLSVLRAQEMIRREVAKGINASDVAKTFNCTQRMAQLRFKAATGHSIMKEIISARLDEARRIVTDNDLTDDAVAQLSGWGTLRNFQHHILQTTGMSLHEWRNSLKTRPR